MVPHREVSARRPGKVPCSCSTDPLVTSATYILLTADQKGIFHGSAFIGFPYFPEIISQFCKKGKKMGVITPFECPSRLCASLYVDFKARDTEVSGPCMCVWIYEQPVQLPGSQGMCVHVNWYQGCTKSFHVSAPLSVHCEILLVQHPVWCFLFEAPGFSLHTVSALFSELSLMDLSGPGGFIELGKIYGFQPCFWGCKWTQAVLKWSIRCIPVAGEAQQILHEGAVGAVQKVRPWRIRRKTEQTVQFSMPQPGVFVVQLGWTGAEAIGFCVCSLQFLHPVLLHDKAMTLCHCKHTSRFPERCVSLGDWFSAYIVGLSSHLCTWTKQFSRTFAGFSFFLINFRLFFPENLERVDVLLAQAAEAVSV